MKVLRKATQTDRILHANSNHPNVHKMACVRTLFGQIESHCTTADTKRRGTQHIYRVCQQYGYSRRFIRRCFQPRGPRASMQQQTNRVAVPNKQGASEAGTRLLSRYGTLVAHKPVKTHVKTPHHLDATQGPP